MTKAKVRIFNKNKGFLFLEILTGKYKGAEQVYFLTDKRKFKFNQIVEVILRRSFTHDYVYVSRVRS